MIRGLTEFHRKPTIKELHQLSFNHMKLFPSNVTMVLSLCTVWTEGLSFGVYFIRGSLLLARPKTHRNRTENSLISMESLKVVFQSQLSVVFARVLLAPSHQINRPDFKLLLNLAWY